MTAAPTPSPGDAPLGALRLHTQVFAAGETTARALLGRRDAFVLNQSPFDRQARLRLPATEAEATEALYLTFLKTQVRPWAADELDALRGVVADLRDRLAPHRLSLPPVVWVVKTSGAEEGDAAYTRDRDAIVLPDSKVATIRAGAAGADALHAEQARAALADIVTHETFHLISKNNLTLRRRLYALVGYEQVDRPIALPDALRDLAITNPDTPELDVLIRLPLADGAPETPLLPVLLADRPYDGGSFFDYLSWRFLPLEPDDAGWRIALGADGKPTLIDAGPLRERYLARVGRSVLHEIFHPDEILAQLFVLTLNRPDAALLGRIETAFAGG